VGLEPDVEVFVKKTTYFLFPESIVFIDRLSSPKTCQFTDWAAGREN
jgi:hypothetical protein